MTAASPLPLNLALFRPGMRLAVAVSGGADSVALLRALLVEEQLGIVLSVIHVHHGIRGADADADADFVAGLAARFDLPFDLHRVDTPGVALAKHESIEEAARKLRYGCFDSSLGAGVADAVATAHTLDDQAETVAHRLLRGAWTEGLGGIHPVVRAAKGAYLRPLLGARRAAIEAYLLALDQPWRTDSSNLDTAFTRNRIRGELMPLLRSFNPRVDSQFANLSAIARDEEEFWSVEMARLLPSILLPGRPVRGGGRASGHSADAGPATVVFAIEIERLRSLAPAVRRRVLRAAAARLNHSLSFDHTEALLSLCGFAPAATIQPESKVLSKHVRSGLKLSGRLDVSNYLQVVRTPRELQFTRSVTAPTAPTEYSLPIPGEALATDYGLKFLASAAVTFASATIRACRPSDRITLKHSGGPKTAKQILERLHLSAEQRSRWPLVEWQGEIIWLRGVQVDSTAASAAGIAIKGDEAT